MEDSLRAKKRLAWQHPNYKRGCTGKVFHGLIGHARYIVYRTYALGRPAQVYKCRYCPGWHVTTSVISTDMRCRAQLIRQPHLYRLRRMRDGGPTKEMVATCVFCGVRTRKYTVLTLRDKFALKAVEIEKELDSKSRFRQNIIQRSDDIKICLTDAQMDLLRHIIGETNEQR